MFAYSSGDENGCPWRNRVVQAGGILATTIRTNTTTHSICLPWPTTWDRPGLTALTDGIIRRLQRQVTSREGLGLPSDKGERRSGRARHRGGVWLPANAEPRPTTWDMDEVGCFRRSRFSSRGGGQRAAPSVIKSERKGGHLRGAHLRGAHLRGGPFEGPI